MNWFKRGLAAMMAALTIFGTSITTPVIAEDTVTSGTKTTETQTNNNQTEAPAATAATVQPTAAATSASSAVKTEYMPAQSFAATASNGVYVSVNADENTFPAGTTMKVTPVSEEVANQAAKDALGIDTDAATAVDITFYNLEGKEIEPANNKNVHVYLSMNESDANAKYEVFHVNDNNQAEKVSAAETGSGLAFDAASFSIYGTAPYITAVDGEYWITNIQVTASGATSKYIKYSDLSASGTSVTSLAPATGKDANGNAAIYWKTKVLHKGETQTGTADVNRATSDYGVEVTMLRNYSGRIQYYSSANSIWNDFASGDQLVFYYLDKVTIGDSSQQIDQVSIALSDWYGSTNRDNHIVEYVVVYPDGTKSNVFQTYYNTPDNYSTTKKLVNISGVYVYANDSNEYTITKITKTNKAGTVTEVSNSFDINLNNYTFRENGRLSSYCLVTIYVAPVTASATVIYQNDTRGTQIASVGYVVKGTTPFDGYVSGTTLINSSITDSSNVKHTIYSDPSSAGWQSVAGKTASQAKEFTLTGAEVSSDLKTLTLHYTEKQYTVTYYDPKNLMTDPQDTSKYYLGDTAIAMTTSTGHDQSGQHELIGWMTDFDELKSIVDADGVVSTKKKLAAVEASGYYIPVGGNITITGDMKLYAVWAASKLVDDFAVTADSIEKTYDGTALTLAPAEANLAGAAITYSVDGGVSYSSTLPSRIDAGTTSVKVKATLKGYTDATCDVTITVKPVAIQLTADSNSKIYDGYALTDSGYTMTGSFIGTEGLASVTVSGSQLFAGSSLNTILSHTLKANTNAANYSITYVAGTLTVNQAEIAIEITAEGNTKVYDGTALTDADASMTRGTLAYGDTIASITVTGSQTDVGESPNVPSSVVVMHGTTDVSANYKPTYINGKLIVTPASLIITTPTKDKVYDGTALTAEGTISGFVHGETATFTTTGTQTAVGSSDNTYTLVFDGTAKEINYTITKTVGTLKVTESTAEIAVVTTGGTFPYDGLAHGAAVAVTGIPTGYHLDTASSSATATNVSTVAATCDTLIIKNAQDVNVTANLKIKKTDGTITITPAVLTVTTPSASKVYNGTALTAEGTISGFVHDETATFATTGTQTAVGSSTNTYSLSWNGTANSSNYTFSESLGTLTVTENASEIVVTTTGGTFTYSGTAHGATVAVSTLPDGYTLETAVSSASATDVINEMPATCTSLVIRNAQGVDVTAKLNIKKVDGSITVLPAQLTVSTPDASKVYNGFALTAAGTISGFVHGETATFTTTGTQTAVGTSPNTYSLAWDGSAKSSNYTVTASIGTLTVTENTVEITVMTTGGTFPYNGTAHGATVAVTGIPDGYHLDTASSSASATDVTAGITATCDTLIIKNAQGVDVTSQLKIKKVDGSIIVTPIAIVLTAESDHKVYNGIALTNTGYELTSGAFISGEGLAGVTVSGSQLFPGSSANTITGHTLAEGTKAVNYTISYLPGTLTVDQAEIAITITANGSSKTYDGTPLTESGYTFTENLASGDAIASVTMSGSQTDAGSSLNTPSAAVIMHDGTDVTANYKITYAAADLTVDPAVLTVITADGEKVYDGIALTAGGTISGFVHGETAAFATTGEQIAAGTSPNTFSIAWTGTAKETNYTINKTIGTLTVTESTDEITVTTTGGTFTYDGTAHGATVAITGIPAGYHLDTAASSASATDVTVSPIAATCDTLIIRNAQNVDVTAKLNITMADGTIAVTPAPLTVTTPSASMVYNGTALTAAGTITGFVNGETAVFTTTGTQTAVGTSPNTYSLAWTGTALQSNYAITSESIGTLTVTPADTNAVLTSSYLGIYDGAAHTITASAVKEGSTLHYTLEAPLTSANGALTASADTRIWSDTLPTFTNASAAVTVYVKATNPNYEDAFGSATVTINKIDITLTSGSAAKDYDGTPLTSSTVTVSGAFAAGEGAAYTVTGTQTESGSTPNTFTYTLNANTNAANYNIQMVEGTLLVRPVTPITPEIPETPGRPSTPSTPNTGDQTNAPLAAAGLGLSLLAAGFVLFFRKRYFE